MFVFIRTSIQFANTFLLFIYIYSILTNFIFLFWHDRAEQYCTHLLSSLHLITFSYITGYLLVTRMYYLLYSL